MNVGIKTRTTGFRGREKKQQRSFIDVRFNATEKEAEIGG